MPDKDKVIKWLNVCKTSHYAIGIHEDWPCRLCPYKEKQYCMKELITDALKLLEEQTKINDLLHNAMRGSADMIELLFKKLDKIVLCKDCEHGTDCENCVECEFDAVKHEYDWFCADGKRKGT